MVSRTRLVDSDGTNMTGPIYTPEDPNVTVVPILQPPPEKPPPNQPPDTRGGGARPPVDLPALGQVAFEAYYNGVRLTWDLLDKTTQQNWINAASAVASAVIKGRPATPPGLSH